MVEMERDVAPPQAARHSKSQSGPGVPVNMLQAHGDAEWTQVSDGTHNQWRRPVGGFLCSDGSDMRGEEGLCEAVMI